MIMGNADLDHMAIQVDVFICGCKKRSDERVRYCIPPTATFWPHTHLTVIAQATMILRFLLKCLNFYKT